MIETALNKGFGVSADDLGFYDWQAIIQTVPRHECYVYNELFSAKAKSLQEAGDGRGERVFGLLSAVASFWPNFHSDEAPFRPVAVLEGRHTPIPEDLSASDLDALAGVLNEIKDGEFKARVADVLWVCRKDYKAAQAAVEAYIESGLVLESGDMWPPFAERFERALQLGAKLGRLKPFHQKAIQAVEDAITRNEPVEKGLLCARFMHLLLADRVGDASKYAALSGKLAKRMESVANWHFARDYWQLNAGWNSRVGKADAGRAAQVQIANTYIKLAEGFISGEKPSYLGASGWMAKAVHALREAKADAAEIEDAHRRLLDYQKRSMSEMETIQVPLANAPDLQQKLETSAKAAAEHVAGHRFEDAIIRFAFVAEPSHPNELRKRIEDLNSNDVFTQIFGATTVRPDGQVSDTKPPLVSDDPKEREIAVLKEMYSQARTVDWPVRVRVSIEPARQKIIAEHPARPVDLFFLVQDNPFVPPGREGLFLRGLHAGLHGDLVLALHLLLPQIENSIREIFTARGIITSKLESDQTQDERDLGWMLAHDEMAQIFGPGMAFDLRGLLVERFGLNLRNDIAHGLLAESQMISEGALYAWWLTLRLCCIPIAAAQRETTI
ncbi:MAG TPA: DUF4209 domain-containing protein [Candidatus Saccharimonadales bacterium]|nr:DUF4209 domain-containing protein [Candidatus Saccharimonadales bacterium]